MTTVRYGRDEVANVIWISGHQDGGKKGENIYCAAVSAMASTLVNGLRGEDLFVAPNIRTDDGDMKITCIRTPRTDAMLDMTLRGFEAMAAKWPDRIKIER